MKTSPRRPTIALAIIIKNEMKNLPRLFDSFNGCFDAVYVTDTGSSDTSVDWLHSHGAKAAGCPVHVSHFKWINDFSAARNFAFSPVKEDFVAWLDADDALSDKAAFIQWRDYAMEFADCWFAGYNYALDKDGKPIISFIRERVFKRSLNPVWEYPIHEGVVPNPAWAIDYAMVWSVNHHRDEHDIIADKSRNITILEKLKAEGQLVPRLKFYYGKELYEQGDVAKAVEAFHEALSEKSLESHDRILSLQYASYAAVQSANQLKDEFQTAKMKLFNEAIAFAHEGMKLDPNRAEFFVTCGDIYLQFREMLKAIPYYAAAKSCFNAKANGSPYEGALYSFVDCYGLNPTLQLAKIYFNLGQIDKSREQAVEALEKYGSDEAKLILAELNRMESLTKIENNQTESEDIVFTCPPQTAYPFDEDIYKTKPLGGSETALVQMARYLREITGRPVKVFNMREDSLVADSGVEYISNKHLNEYMSKFRPKVHIAWRHNIEITKAKTFLWCHDLVTPSVEGKRNFDKILCLTEFHKNYVMAKQGVPQDQIIVTRNGITESKFQFDHKPKDPNKILWMSSPDRGLDLSMLVLDKVRLKYPDIKLHVYYGLENLRKYGLNDLADKIDTMIKERPWVVLHGFTEQSKMYQEASDGVVWCHPATFIETFCITALEMLALGVFPVTRRLGALTNTLADAESKGQAVLMDFPANTEVQIQSYADEVIDVLDNNKWEAVNLDLHHHDWRTIASEWVEFMEIK